MKKNINNLLHWKWQLVSVLFAVSFAVVLFQYVQMKKQVSGPDSQEILQKLSHLMVLPSGKPDIRPITDMALIKEQWPDFYTDVRPGDILVQYPTSAILYDPEKQKILNVFTNGILNKPHNPTNVLKIAVRFNGNDQYRALFFKRQVEEDMGNSAYQVIEVSQSNAIYTDDVIYVVNPKKQELVSRFAKTIGNSPVVATPDKNEAPTNADIIVSFKAKQ